VGARADARLALDYWPWSLLAQPEPFPERILTAVPQAIVEKALGGGGSPSAVFPPEVRAAYVQALRDPAHAHAICEEYRAAATLDREHDKAGPAGGRRIARPLLGPWGSPGALGSARGALAIWYAGAGGPLALWREWSNDARGHPLEAGHFFPEEAPGQTADALSDFFAVTDASVSRNRD